MEQTRIYPVGTQDFSLTRSRQMVNIDKTRYIYRMANRGADFIFHSRLRRFGNTITPE